MSNFSDVSDEGLASLGNAALDLPPMHDLETPVNVGTPVAAGELLQAREESFEWRPIPTLDWNSLLAEERGKIVLDRAVAWLEQNAQLINADVAFVDVEDYDANRAFGMDVHNVHEALCAAYGMIQRNEVVIDTVIILAGVVATSAGLHFAALTTHGVITVIKAYGRRKCH